MTDKRRISSDDALGLYAVMLSELPQVGDQVAARILALDRERGHGLATFFRLPEAVLHEDYKLNPATIRRVCAERDEHERRSRWLLDQFVAAGGAVALVGEAGYPTRVQQRLRPPPAVLYG